MAPAAVARLKPTISSSSRVSRLLASEHQEAVAGEDRAGRGRAQKPDERDRRAPARARRAWRPDSGSPAPARAGPRARSGRASRWPHRCGRRCPASTFSDSTAASAARTWSVGTTRGASSRHRPRLSSQVRAYTPAGTACGSARAIVLKAARSRGPLTRAVEATGTITTSVFESRSLRSAARTRPACSSASIWAESAEKKTSAGAPARIWRERSLEAPKLKTAWWPEAASQAWPTSASASARLAAANTLTFSRSAGGAAASPAPTQSDTQSVAAGARNAATRKAGFATRGRSPGC